MSMLSRSNSLMDDEDPGIMSEAETSATGFRRGSKQRTSLPVVRTPSKTMERPLGLVFLQYRHETKRALLPNEITTLDTVRALFVRSFPRQLSMEYFDSHDVRIYIHDSNQDMFYELEDLRDIRDRSILRLFENEELKHPINFQYALPVSLSQMSFLDDSTDIDQPLDLLNPRLMPVSPLSSGTWDEVSYFSEPEFDSDYRPQNVHKAKNRATKPPIGLSNGRQTSLSSTGHTSAATLIQAPLMARNLQARAGLNRSFSITAEQAPPSPRIDRNAVVSPVKLARDYSSGVPCDPPAPWDEDSAEVITSYFPCSQQAIPPQVPPRPPERSFHNYGSSSSGKPTYVPPSSSLTYARTPAYGNGYNDIRPPPSSVYPSSATDQTLVDEQTRKRMEQVERQLASLTGLVQTALTGAVGVHGPARSDNGPESSASSALGLSTDGEKCVSFEKSVSFCDDPVDLHEGKHSPQPTESKPSKPAIKSSTLPRASSQGWIGSMETYTQLRLLQRNARDLRSEMRSLRRLSQAQLSAVKEAVKDTIQIMKKTFLANSDLITNALAESEPVAIDTSLKNIYRQEENYQKEMKQLEKDLSELEVSVENLRSHVINKKTRVSMADVEQLATLLSRSSKSVDLLKSQFPALEESIKGVLAYQLERQAEETRFLAEAPNKLDNSIGRCKKLTSTLVTLRRLASVQEQRQPHVSVSEKTSTQTKSSATNYSTSAPGDSPANVNRSNTSQQRGSRFEAAQQSNAAQQCDAFTASSELQSAHRAVSIEYDGVVDVVNRIVPWCSQQQQQHQQHNGGHSQRSEPRSPSTLDALLDELKLYSETSQPGVEAVRTKPTANAGPGQRAQPLPILDPSMQSISMSPLSTPVSYDESSAGSAVPSSNNVATNRRRAPPPPPPRTSSRSPLASPLRAPRNLQARPLPSLPPTAENNQLTLSRVTTESAPPSPQSTAHSQRQMMRITSLNSNEPKVPIATQAGKIDSNPTLAASLPKSGGITFVSQVSQLRVAAPTSPSFSLPSASARTIQAESNTSVTVCEGETCVPPVSQKRDTLESRHQELLKTQKHLQEQYNRLQKFHGAQFVSHALCNTSIAPLSPSHHASALGDRIVSLRPSESQSSKRFFASDVGLGDRPITVSDQDADVAVGNEINKDTNQIGQTADSDQQLTTSAAKIDAEADKNRDFHYISLLLDNTHETDIL